MSDETEIGQRYRLPPGFRAYRKIGPFNGDNLPAGLLREHRLKEGTWANLTVLAGEIGFVWDDPDSDGEMTVLVAGDSINVPPTIPHHLEMREEGFSLEIEFLSDS